MATLTKQSTLTGATTLTTFTQSWFWSDSNLISGLNGKFQLNLKGVKCSLCDDIRLVFREYTDEPVQVPVYDLVASAETPIFTATSDSYDITVEVEVSNLDKDKFRWVEVYGVQPDANIVWKGKRMRIGIQTP
jgi:hypothetical protein